MHEWVVGSRGLALERWPARLKRHLACPCVRTAGALWVVASGDGLRDARRARRLRVFPFPSASRRAHGRELWPRAPCSRCTLALRTLYVALAVSMNMAAAWECDGMWSAKIILVILDFMWTVNCVLSLKTAGPGTARRRVSPILSTTNDVLYLLYLTLALQPAPAVRCACPCAPAGRGRAPPPARLTTQTLLSPARCTQPIAAAHQRSGAADQASARAAHRRCRRG